MLKTKAPDAFFIQLNQTMRPSVKVAFLSACIIGFLTHAYVMTHQFLNYDAMWNLYSDQNMIASGRQFLQYACGLSSYYALPWLNGVLSILFLALTSVAVVSVFRIESRIPVILTSAVLVTFPTIASTFCYMFTADGYMLAIALSAFACLWCERKKWGWVGGLFLLGIGIGIYQAYLSLAIVMCICYLLLSLIEEDDLKSIAAKTLRFGFMGVGGYAFYVISLKIMLKIQGASMSGYQGTDKVGTFAFAELPNGLIAALKTTAAFVLRSNVLRPNRMLTVVLAIAFLATIIMYVVIFIQKKRYTSWVRIVAVLLLLLMLPFGLSTISIMSPDAYFHLLMRMPWAVLLVFPLALSERFTVGEQHSKSKKTIKATVMLAIGVLAFAYAVISNVAYFNMNERYEKTYAFCLRLANRLEQTKGYEQGMEVAVLGGVLSPESYPPTEVTTQALKGYFGASGEICVDSTQKIAAFMQHYQNVTIQTVSDAREQELAATKEYAQMAHFPASESIQMIDGVWVVKLQ